MLETDNISNSNTSTSSVVFVDPDLFAFYGHGREHGGPGGVAWFTDVFNDEVEQEGEPDGDGEGNPLFPGSLG